MNSCLNCKYEPVWSTLSKGEEGRSLGECQYEIPEKINLPACCSYNKKQKTIIRYKDDSGVHLCCDVWEAKK